MLKVIHLIIFQLFDRVVDPYAAESCELHLVGVVCYYGKHYSTFFFHSKMKKWISFDDANVKDVSFSLWKLYIVSFIET